jgi:hypothetical protein
MCSGDPTAPRVPSGIAFIFGRRRAVSDALKRAQRYRYLEKECRRLATIETSTEIRNNYLRMAEHFTTLAEAEELTTSEQVSSD